MTGEKPVNPFILPKRFTPSSLGDEYDRKKFKQWVSDLPIGDASKLARSLYHEIARQNRLDMSPVERFDAMQLMMPSLAYVLDKLWGRFSTKPIPLPQEDVLIARLHLELLVNVVVAYKTILSQFHDDSFTGYLLHKRSRSAAVRYALHFLGEILLHKYALYQASLKFVWKEMHGVYHYAVANELQRNEAEDDGPFVGSLSIDDIYKRALLLALAVPSSLLRGEAKKVNDTLVDWLPQASIVSVTECTAGGMVLNHPVFVVDSTKDAPPYVADIDAIRRVKLGWVLLTDRLEMALDEELGKTDVEPGGRRPVALVTSALLTKLRGRWRQGAVTREERTGASDTLEAVYGLEQLHHLLGGWKFLPDVEEDADESQLSEPEEKGCVQPVYQIEQDEFIIEADAELFAAITAELGGSGEDQEEDGLEVQGENGRDLDDAVVDMVPHGDECASINRSKGGYHLVWLDYGESKAHVGEMIGVSSTSSMDMDGSWKMGVIRWMRVQTNGLMGFGIELFAGDVEPIRLDYRSDKSFGIDSMPGFQQKIGGKIASIITRPFFFGDNSRFIVTGVDRCVPVVAGGITECTDAFMRFEVSVDAKALAMADKHAGSEDMFDSIWDNL